MAVSAETQRLISVSLGKIAQSRGQRGGINLHKNLLVATVLHKARTAYMMESYNYQQNLHRQKLLEQYQMQQLQHQQHLQQQQQQQLQQQQQQLQRQLQQQQNLHSLGQKADSLPLGELNKGDMGPVVRDSIMGHAVITPKMGEQTIRSDISSFNGPSLTSQGSNLTSQGPTLISPGPTLTSHEHTLVQECKAEIVRGKENSPPALENLCVLTENVPVVSSHQPASHESHLAAATQLSQEVQMASSEQFASNKNIPSTSSTCSVLKRRRENTSTSLHDECSSNKIAKLIYDNHSTTNSDYSSDTQHESHSQSDIHHSPEHHQISSLVTIFNSGFSELCINPSSDLHTTGYQSDFVDISMSLTRNISVKAG